MNQKNNIHFDFYMDAVRNIVPDVQSVVEPPVRGYNSIVLIASGQNRKFVFRFNKNNTQFRNVDISDVMKKHDIPIPQYQSGNVKGQIFEYYPYCPGQTFRDYIDKGMTKSEIIDVYWDLATLFDKMLKISPSEFNGIYNKNCYEVAESNFFRKTQNRFSAKFIRYSTQILNYGSNNVFHCDLTPQNILLDDTKRVRALLDLDAFSVCNLHYAVAGTGYKLHRNGLNQNVFYEILKEKIPNRINLQRLKITQTAFELYCPYYFRKNKRR